MEGEGEGEEEDFGNCGNSEGRAEAVNRDRGRSRLATTNETRVHADFADVLAIQQPAKETLEAETVSTVRLSPVAALQVENRQNRVFQFSSFSWANVWAIISRWCKHLSNIMLYVK